MSGAPNDAVAGDAATAFGYDSVAKCINYDRDLAQYRRFGVLNARNLLYLQSELMSLETRLGELDAEANNLTRGNAVWSIPRSWHALAKAQDEHLEVVLKIRSRLDEYNRALQQQAWLLSLKKPDTRPMQNLAAFLRANSTNIATSDAEFLAPKHQSDLVAIATSDKEPVYRALERWFYWLFGYKNSELSGENGNMARYSDGKIRNFARGAAVVASSLLPILSIVGLYFIQDELIRLGLVVAFCFICSATMAALTNAKNIEIIAATAAYTAVQVVFVSGTSPSI